jgi:hypothetical protein
VQRNLVHQRKYGDGHMKERARYQDEALQHWKDIVFKSLIRMQARAERGHRHDWQIKLRDQKTACEVQWTKLRQVICETGERFRDQYWLALHRGAIVDTVREDVLPHVETGMKMPRRTGPACIRDLELEARIGARRQFLSSLFPAGATYRRERSGRPWPPFTPCAKALRALRPRPSTPVVDALLVAWSFKPFPR